MSVKKKKKSNGRKCIHAFIEERWIWKRSREGKRHADTLV